MNLLLIALSFMKYRILGRTGINVSTIGMGCEGLLELNQQQTDEIISYAIEHGVNFMDMYAPNPDFRDRVGISLKGRREKFVLQGHICSAWINGQYLRTRDEKKTIDAFDDQLRRLQTDYIDIGMIHYVDTIEDFHKIFDGALICLAKCLKSDGKIRYIGMSSHNPLVALEAVKTGMIDVLLFSINPAYDMQPATDNVEDLWADEHYVNKLENINPDRERLYELCEEKGVGIDVMKVYGGGDMLNENMSPLSKAFTPVQCINYALTRPGVASVMVGVHSKHEIDEAIAWCDATDKEKDYSSVMSQMDKFTWQGHCMYCGHCAPCTVAIDIASVNKLYNLTVAEGFVPETVREHYKVLAHHASECTLCGACEKRCPFGVSIIEKMKNAVNAFGY
jgi:predicted aldo/keto reductase-like oxidoreductase